MSFRVRYLKQSLPDRQADNSNIYEYDWYEWVMLHDNTTSYPDDRRTLGIYIGSPTDLGYAMCYKILRSDGQIACRTTVRALTLSERADFEQENLRTDFDTNITYRLGATATMGDFDTSDLTPACVYYKNTDTATRKGSQNEILPTPESGGNYVNMEIILPKENEMDKGRVTKRACDSNGNPLGTANNNPIIDNRQYIVEFSDGDEANLAANVIATNMYSQCDPDGNQYVLLDSIIDFRRSTTALCCVDQKTTQKWRTYYQRSTAVWQLCCQWKDSSTPWTKISNIKE